jgi:hypothetical protein
MSILKSGLFENNPDGLVFFRKEFSIDDFIKYLKFRNFIYEKQSFVLQIEDYQNDTRY